MIKEFAKRLKRERELRSWSQEQIAEMLGTTAPNVSRWERGITLPGLHFRQKLCECFGMSAEAFGLTQAEEDDEIESLISSSCNDLAELVSPPTQPSPVWNVPYRRNPFFTGREDVLWHLHEMVQSNNSAVLAQIPAISGLGGIGKTTTAIEYAYRHRDEYPIILWVHAGTRDTLIADFVTIANVLNLHEKDDQDWHRIIEAVKSYLSHHMHWLLILDNVENIDAVEGFIPLDSKGYVIMTTRAQSTGTFAQRIDLEQMEPDEGALFLLRRSKLLVSHAPLEQAWEMSRTIAKEISHMVDGLPLALDQAGAYIEETACTLSDYLELYHHQRAHLLDLRGSGSWHHPQSVSATLSLSFEKIAQKNAAATELLELCSFLHPDAIPEEMIAEGAIHLGSVLAPVASDPLKRDAALAELRKYSLLRRNPETKMLTIHRAVQAVLKDRMSENKQHQWAERVVHLVNHAFPDVKDSMVTWDRCQRYLLQAQVAIILIEQWKIISEAAGRLLNQTGTHLSYCGQYTTQAEVFIRKALDITRPILGPEHPDVATCLHNLAGVYLEQAKYGQAEPLYQQALAIREKVLGSKHYNVAISLNDLGMVYCWEGKFIQGELVYERALETWKGVLGPENDSYATLNNLGCLYLYQGKFAQAESLLSQALAIYDETVGPDHILRAYMLDNLARLYRDSGVYSRAESLFEQALSMRELHLGPEHYLVAETLSDYAKLCYHQGKYLHGEQFCQRSILIWKQTVGTKHPRIAQAFNILAILLHSQDQFRQAESFAQQALVIREQTLGSEHPKVAQTLTVLGDISCKQGTYVQAESLYHQALKIYKQSLGSENHRVAQILDSLAMLYLAQMRYNEAEEHCLRALTLREKILGKHHPDAAQSLSHLADIYYHQARYDLAEHSYQQVLVIQEQVLGAIHPTLATTLEHYAICLLAVHRKHEAAPLKGRVNEIRNRHIKENTRERDDSPERVQ